MDIAVNGQTIHAANGGRTFDPSLPTVVLLHGAGMDHTVWQFQARTFAHHGYGVLSVDLPGHGRSDDPAPTTIAEYTSTVAAMLDTAGRRWFDRSPSSASPRACLFILTCSLQPKQTNASPANSCPLGATPGPLTQVGIQHRGSG
jgi:alpha-beta hydrolase superfamily lysophospholipase